MNVSSERFTIRLLWHKSNYFWVRNCAVWMLMHWKLRKDFVDLIDDTFNGRSQSTHSNTHARTHTARMVAMKFVSAKPLLWATGGDTTNSHPTSLFRSHTLYGCWEMLIENHLANDRIHKLFLLLQVIDHSDKYWLSAAYIWSYLLGHCLFSVLIE